jgi:hypothetical protein
VSRQPGKSRVAEPADHGELIWSKTPASVNLRNGVIQSNTGWPFPRRFEIHTDGLYLTGTGASAFLKRDDIDHIVRGLGELRFFWHTGGKTQTARISAWQIQRFVDALSAAGYSVESPR